MLGTVDLADTLKLDEAIRVNTVCQRADGIESIDENGTVTFTESEMAVMKRLLGYECTHMKLEESAEWAHELGRKYEEFASMFD